VSKVDKQLAEYILEHHKPAIFVVNKWDLMAPMPTGKFAQYVRATFPSLDFVPVAFITATSGKNVYAVLNLAQNLHKQASARVGTSELNRVLRQALDQHTPPLRQNRRPKVYFATQVASNPPTIVLFTNGPGPVRQDLSALSAEHVPRPAAVQGHPDQTALAAQAARRATPAGPRRTGCPRRTGAGIPSPAGAKAQAPAADRRPVGTRLPHGGHRRGGRAREQALRIGAVERPVTSSLLASGGTSAFPPWHCAAHLLQ